MATKSETAIATTQAALSHLKKAAVKQRQQQPKTGFDPYLRFTRGDWTYGTEGIDVQPGSLWAIDPTSYMSGYVCWTRYPEDSGKKDENLGQVMNPLGHDPIDKSKLDQHIDPDGYNNGKPWPWEMALEVRLKCISGEDKGQEVVYSASSKGGLDLLNAYLDNMLEQLDNGTPVAVVKLGKDHYTHKRYGRTYTPEFEYVEWRGLEDTTPADEEPQDEPAQVEDKSDNVADEGDAPKPTRTRRRPAA